MQCLQLHYMHAYSIHHASMLNHMFDRMSNFLIGFFFTSMEMCVFYIKSELVDIDSVYFSFAKIFTLY